MLSKPGIKNGVGHHPPGQNNASDFLHKQRFTNTLPDLPYDGKYLKVNLGTLKERFGDYKPTQMEVTSRRMMMCDMDVGVDIDLVDPATYRILPNAPATVDAKDEDLLQDESAQSLLKLKRSAQHAQAVPFMRRTEYISAEFNRFGLGADRQETKVGYNLLKNLNPDDIFYRDRESQVAAINRTFEDVKKPATQHPCKPGVIAVEELPVFPDFENIGNTFAEVMFDNEPGVYDMPEELQKTALKRALLMGLEMEGNVLGHFTPNVETVNKMIEDEEEGVQYRDEEDYIFPLNRDYIWTLRTKAQNDIDEDYAFYERDGCMYYCELGVKVRLQRRRRVPGELKPEAALQIRYREFTEEEKEAQAKQTKKLLEGESDESEEDSDDEEESEKSGTDNEAPEEEKKDESPQKDGADDDAEEGDKAPKEKTKSPSSSPSNSSNSSNSSSSSDTDSD